MRCKQWIFDMDGTLTDSMTVVWRGAPLALLQRYGRTPKADLNDVLLTMGMADGARYLIREYDLPLTEAEYYDVMRDVIAQLYETVDLKPGVRTLLAKLQAEGARLCLCSNTWSDQCRTVLTRLGIADYFSFIVEAQGVLHKSRPEVFFECMHRLGGPTPPPAPCARTPFTPLPLPTRPGSPCWACRTLPVPPTPLPWRRCATSSCRTGPHWTGQRSEKFFRKQHAGVPAVGAPACCYFRLYFCCCTHCWKASRTAPSRPRGMEMRAPLRMRSSPAESRSASARLTT